MVISQGDVLWADLAAPSGSGPVFRRPVAVVQGDDFNASRIATVVVVPLTSNLKLAAAPGNFVIPGSQSGLPRDSVVNVSQIVTVDRDLLDQRVGHLLQTQIDLILNGIDLVLGRA